MLFNLCNSFTDVFSLSEPATLSSLETPESTTAASSAAAAATQGVTAAAVPVPTTTTQATAEEEETAVAGPSSSSRGLSAEEVAARPDSTSQVKHYKINVFFN